MTQTRIGPRIETEAQPAPRLEAAPVVLPVAVPERWGSAAVGLAGAAVLAVGLGGLWCADFVQDQFARGPVAGWLTLGVAVLGGGLVGAGLWREFRALAALSAVDRLRRELASGDLRRMRRAALHWVARLDMAGAGPSGVGVPGLGGAGPDAAGLRAAGAGSAPGASGLTPALRAVDTPEALLALLHAGPQAALRGRADALARTAALQMAGAVAVPPAPALDVAVLAWRGVRLVRQVAELHGMRPGLLGTLALLRRTALAAAAVAATELAVNAATHALLTHPLLDHVLGDMAGAGVAARRMFLLGRAAAAACCPLPPR